MKHEIIVYRNPVEAFYWENPEYIGYLIVGAVLIVGCLYLWAWIKERFFSR